MTTGAISQHLYLLRRSPRLRFAAPLGSTTFSRAASATRPLRFRLRAAAASASARPTTSAPSASSSRPTTSVASAATTCASSPAATRAVGLRVDVAILDGAAALLAALPCFVSMVSSMRSSFSAASSSEVSSLTRPAGAPTFPAASVAVGGGGGGANAT